MESIKLDVLRVGNQPEMMKQGCRKSIKSIIESHIDPEENEKFRRIKAEIAVKLREILGFLKEEGDNDKNDFIGGMIEDFKNHYDSLYSRYCYLTKELKEEFYGSSSSSSSESDDYPQIVEIEGADFGTAKSLRKLIVSKNEEINQLKEAVDDLNTELEIKEDEINALMEKMRGTEVKEDVFVDKEERHRKETEVLLGNIKFLQDVNGSLEAKITSEVGKKMDQTLKGIDTLRLKFEGHFGHLKSQILEISNELKDAMNWISEKDQLKEEEREFVSPIQKMEEVEKMMRERDELDRKMSEKESEILSLNEEKTKAVKQLCTWIDYYQSRNENLKDMFLKARGAKF